uniref:Kinesin-like protein KIF3A (inferred by orthology to a human protein) n=1 Tax=Anisakis simplex TaxID=6269 RepID=A0A0M3KC26_ANISI
LQCANIGPAAYNYDETVSTLRYANRAKNIKNVARINEDPKDALLRKFQLEIEHLKKLLAADDSSAGSGEDEMNEENGADSIMESNNNNIFSSSMICKRVKGRYDERIEQLEKNIGQKRIELEKEKGLAEEERQALAAELSAKEAELSRAKAEHSELMNKLHQIEKRLIVGGENMLEKAEKQAKLLAESNAELERARANESHLRKALAEKNQERVDLEEKYNSLAEEAHGKTKKLKKVWTMLSAAKSELADVQSEHQREMEGLLDSIRQLRSELLLQLLIIDNYIPTEYLEMIERFVWWNEEMGDWQLKCIAYTGNNMRARNPLPTPVYKVENPQMRNLFLSYADEIGQNVQIEPRSAAKVRLKSAKRERDAARLKALLH